MVRLTHESIGLIRERCGWSSKEERTIIEVLLWWSSINRRKLLLPPSHNPITTILLSGCRTKFVRKINP